MKKQIIFASTALITLPAAYSAVVISEIDLANNRVELVNTGTTTESLTSFWWCNRVNGSPFYTRVSDDTINSSLSSATSFSSLGAGQTLVLDLGAGLLPDANGELGLYNTNSFGSATALEDYVLWGGNGVRDSVAQNAGIWSDNEFIDVSNIGAGESIQLSLAEDGDLASEYFIGGASLGVAQSIPEPSSFLLLSLSCLGLLRRRRK